MKEVKKIWFPVDLSEASPEIVPWVLLTAKKFAAELRMLFVVQKFDHFRGFYVPQVSIENFEGEIIKCAEKKIEEFANRYFEGYPGCMPILAR